MYGQQGTCANSKYMLSKGLLASKSVVTVSKRRTVPVKILNPSNDAITIHKRKAIANCMPITSCTQIQPVSVNENKVQNVNLKQSDSEFSESGKCPEMKIFFRQF